MELGELGAASESVKKGLEGVDLTNFTFPNPMFVMLARCELFLAQADYPAAETHAEEMIKTLQNAGARALLPDALRVKGGRY